MRRKTKFLKMNTTVIKVTKKTTHRVDGSEQRMTSLEIAARAANDLAGDCCPIRKET